MLAGLLALVALASPAGTLAAVPKEPQTITLRVPGTQQPGAKSATVSASSDSGLPVSFTASPSTVCTVGSSTGSATVTIKASGTCTVVAYNNGNAYVFSGSKSGSFIILKTQTITVNWTLRNKTLGAPSFSLSGLATASSGLTVTYSVAPTANCAIDRLIVSILLGAKAGYCTVTANQVGSAYYAPATSAPMYFYVGNMRQKIADLANQKVNGTAGNFGCSGAWCACFAKWVWTNAGVPPFTQQSVLNSWAHSFYDYGKNNGTYSSTTPHLGDAVVFLGHGTSATDPSTWDTEGNQNIGIQHVAIVTWVSPDKEWFISVGGNQGGIVSANPAYSSQLGAWANNLNRDNKTDPGTQQNGSGVYKIGGFIAPIQIDNN